MEDKQSTLEKIHIAAKAEFMEKGFRSASLRNIVKTAGVTTGAFYGYYSSKEELFDALVGEQAEYVLNLVGTTIDDFEKLSGEEQTQQMVDVSGDALSQMLNYIYDNYDAFKMIILCAEGTRYDDFVHQLVLREEESTYTYIETLNQMGYSVEPINKKLIHMIASGLFSGVFETIVHDMPKAEAKEYVLQLQRFNTAGWEELLGVKFGK
ncbi:MAG: TetR/AcrR family transcriptional regulator [Eubacterium sp.]